MKNTEQYKLYPEINEVFLKPDECYPYIFFPLLSLDLEQIGIGKGKVHYIHWAHPDVEFAENFSHNCIKFSLDEKGEKYMFHGDIASFYETALPNLRKWYQEAREEFEKNKEAYISQTSNNPSEVYTDNNNRRDKVDSKYGSYVKLCLDYMIYQEQYLMGGVENMLSYRQIKDFNILDKAPLDEDDIEYLSEFVEIPDVTLDSKNHVASVCGQDYVGLFNGGADVINLFKDYDKQEIIMLVQWC